MNFRTYLISLIAFINLYYVSCDDDVAPNGIPLIWPSIRPDKSYRIMYQLEMFRTPERVTVEEWASFEKQLFRLDLVSSETRITYLTNGKTNEVFRYKPFICDQLSADSIELGVIGNLFKGCGLVEDSNSTMAYGLGPLWLRTRKDAKDVKVMSKDSPGFRRHVFLNRYYGFETSFADEKIPYNLRLYFPQDKFRFVDVVEWVVPQDKKQAVSSNNIEARAKLMYLDLTAIDDSIFELPLGYGCKRQDKFDLPDANLGLDLLHDGNSNQAIFEVTTSRPRDELLNSWMSQRYSINLLRGSLRLNEQLHSYYVTLNQWIDPMTSRLRRTKRVWSAPKINKTEAIVYTIEETNGECTVERMNFRDLIRLPFPVEKNMPLDSPIPLDLGLIVDLFDDHKEFHSLRDRVNRAQGPGERSFREMFYEKRVEKLNLTNTDNTLAWSGPVSIVKRVKSFTIALDDPQSKPLVSNYHTTVTLLFYDPEMSKLLFKAVIDLLGNDEQDISFLHKKLDIGVCFSERETEDILIKYPLESQEFSRRLSAIDDLVRDRFLMNLFGTTPIQPIQVSDIELSFDNFFMYVKMTLIDLPLRLTFDYKLGYQLTNTSPATNSKIVEKTSSSVDKCAASCDYYGCFRFSYDHIQYKCVIELEDGVAKIEPNYSSDLYEYVEYNIKSAWSKYDESGGRAHLRPSTVLELFKELLTYESPEDDGPGSATLSNFSMPYENVPLRIYIDSELLSAVDPGRTDFIELRPISVHSDMDSVNEFVREEQSTQNSSILEANGSVVKVHHVSNLQIQYSILFEGRQFNEDMGEHFVDMSYDDCAELCESNDCRSFSYCESKQQCLVTNLHKTAEVKKATTENPLCSVHALDYLSKFEDFGWAQTPVVVKSVIEGTSKEDCANACMEEQNFNCQGFYHCSKFDMALEDQTISCLLQDKHIEELDPNDRSSPKFKARLMLTKEKVRYGIDCRYFSRSYLAQFDEYLGKELKCDTPASDVALAPGSEIVVGLGAEECAKLCIQESCLAFHICLDPQDHTRVCSLAKLQIRKHNLVAKKRCTTFVLSDKSQFNLKTTKLISAEPDREALSKESRAPDVVLDPEQKVELENDTNKNLFDWLWDLDQVKQIKEGSHFLSKFMSLLFGLFIGVTIAIVWLQKDSIYNMATRVGSYYRTRT